MAIVKKMREDHLGDLRAEKERSVQGASLGQDNLRLHVEELGEVWEDIEANIRQIVEQVDQPSYDGCMNTYRNSLQLFRHKLEEYSEEEQHFTTYVPQDLQAKLELFQQQLMELWEASAERGTAGDKRQQERTTVKNVHEMLPRNTAHHNG